MNRNNIAIAALGFGFLAVIFFIAPSFSIVEKNVGSFLGIASGVVAAFCWTIRGRLSQ